MSRTFIELRNDIAIRIAPSVAVNHSMAPPQFIAERTMAITNALLKELSLVKNETGNVPDEE